MSRFEVDYIVTVAKNQSAETLAAEICLEQTVEIPEDCIPSHVREKGLPGKIERIAKEETSDNRYLITISYLSGIADSSVSQFLNTLFGNISLKNNIRINGIRLGNEFSSLFPGPLYGVSGIRQALNVYDRPLVCTALKPAGLSSSELAAMAYAFAKGGADIIKDDHGISNQRYSRFDERIVRVQNAVREANAKYGTSTIYAPMVNDEPSVMLKQLDLCARNGIKGVLAAPSLIGYGAFAEIRRNHEFILIAHPALAGTFFYSPEHGATPAFFLGTLFRLLGADISIFPNSGGRFLFSPSDCDSLCDSLRNPLNALKAAFPAPAGGMRISNIPEMYDRYGKDTVFIIGGNLLQISSDLSESAGMFLSAVSAVSGKSETA